jgi:hypothetical protein
MLDIELLRDRVCLAIVGGGAIAFGIVGIVCNLVWCFALGLLFWHIFQDHKSDMDDRITASKP